MANRRQARRLYEEALNRYGREIADAFRAAVRDLRAGVDIQAVISALERGNIEAAVEAMNLDRAAYANLEAKIREAYTAGGVLTAQTVPAAVGIGFRFNPGDPGAERWLREHSSRLITGLVEEQREAVRAVLVQGRIDGTGPRALITELVGRVSRATGQRTGGILGLSRPQIEHVSEMRRVLTSPNGVGVAGFDGEGNAIRRFWIGRDGTLQSTYTRRDRRLDRTIAKAIRDGTALPSDVVRASVTRYETRLAADRAVTIGKYEAKAALGASRQEAYDQLIASGRMAEDDLEKVWLGSSAKNKRDSHISMAGQTVGIREAFTSPTGARMMHPGDGSLGAGASDLVGCQCDWAVRVKRRPE